MYDIKQILYGNKENNKKKTYGVIVRQIMEGFTKGFTKTPDLNSMKLFQINYVIREFLRV